MIADPKVYEARGLTEKRLKQIFTSEQGAERPVEQKPAFDNGQGDGVSVDPADSIGSYPANPTDWQIRSFFEGRIRMRVQEGINLCMRNYSFYQAIDMAMDGNLINKVQLPLQLMAQGYLNLEACHKQVSGVSSTIADQIFDRDDQGRAIKANVPKLFEVSHNLVHSLVTRRVAAISTPIRQRFPFLKYESRTTSMVGAMMGDMMTQYTEIMTDNYGYRHAVEQTARDVSCYSRQLEFIRAPWDSVKQPVRIHKKRTGADSNGTSDDDYEIVDRVVKEGLDFVNPHPSRVFWDLSMPLARVNSDTGPNYIGYWDVARIGDLVRDSAYWNREALSTDSGIADVIQNNRTYFDFYYKDRIAVPSKRGVDPAADNNRSSEAINNAESVDDSPISLTYYFEKINPKQWGICDYDADLWVRFIVAGFDTVIWADVCGSTPCVCYSYNENDNRILSPTFASLVIPYQDQVSNLLSQLLEIQHQGLLRLYELNKDGMDSAEISKVEKALLAEDYSQAQAIIIKYSASDLGDMGVNPNSQYQQRLRAIQISTTEKTTEIFKSIMDLISMAERLLFFSPQELGQVSPREISAKEAGIINNTTLGIRDFHAAGIEEGLDAKKRIIYESAVAFGSDQIELPVMGTYSPKTVEAAGFKVIEASNADPATDGTFEVVKSGRFTLSGNTRDLVHNYVFTSRDGPERTPSSAVAQASVQLIDVIGRYPMLSQAMVIEDGVELINQVSRSLGVPISMRVPDGMDPKTPMSQNPQQQFAEFAQGVQQAIQSLAGGLQQQQKATKDIADQVTKLAGVIEKRPTPRGAVSPDIPRGAPPLTPTQPYQPFLPVGG